MLLSSVSIAILAAAVILQPSPWYHPQYLIPLLGMLLGNTMTGIAVAMDNLTRDAWNRQGEIEARLMLGQHASEARYRGLKPMKHHKSPPWPEIPRPWC